MADNVVEQEEKEKKSWKRELFDWIKALVIAVVVALLLVNFVIVNAVVPSGSMENTIQVGDRVIGLRPAYLFSSPKRGDIIVFINPDWKAQQEQKRQAKENGTTLTLANEIPDNEKLYVKRIIGLPGETVQIKDNKVYINDSETPLSEDYVKDVPNPNGIEMSKDYGPYEVPEGCYLMLGDNRNNSHDSRQWGNPYLPKEDIIGKVYFRYYPNIEWLA